MNPAPDPDRILRMMAEDAEAEAGMDRIFALGSAAVERDLVAGGVDLDKVRADAAALPEALAARVARERAEAAKAAAMKTDATDAPDAPVVPIAFHRRRKVQVFVAVGAVLILGGAVAAFTLRGDIPMLRPENTWPSPREKTPEQKRAALLREEARAACELRDAVKCGQKLDDARALDPGGEKGTAVVETRKMLDTILAVPDEPDKTPGRNPPHR